MKTKHELVKEENHDFESLVSVMSALRSEGGCPWDIEQTHSSVRKCLIEETYEVIEAIDKNDPVLLCEELGDLMFQVLFHARIEEEEGRFDINDVIRGITHKMIVRHPHVFADTEVSSSSEVLVNWDNIKRDEKKIKDPLDGLKRVPPHLPALIRSQKVQGKAKSKLGYEIGEEKEAFAKISRILEKADHTEEDFAEILFAVCTAGENRGLDLEALLSKRTDDFIKTVEKNI